MRVTPVDEMIRLLDDKVRSMREVFIHNAYRGRCLLALARALAMLMTTNDSRMTRWKGQRTINLLRDGNFTGNHRFYFNWMT